MILASGYPSNSPTVQRPCCIIAVSAAGGRVAHPIQQVCKYNCLSCPTHAPSNLTSLPIQVPELPNPGANPTSSPIQLLGGAGGRGAEGLARHRRWRCGALSVFVFCFWGPLVVGLWACECWRNRVFCLLSFDEPHTNPQQKTFDLLIVQEHPNNAPAIFHQPPLRVFSTNNHIPTNSSPRYPQERLTHPQQTFNYSLTILLALLIASLFQ